MPALFSNYASAPLAASISAAATTVTVTTGQGALFPAIPAGSYVYATLTDSSNNLEVVKVTARASDVLTVVRAQEGTTARAYAAADKIELRLTAAGLNNMVQLDGVQTISGVKTFTSGIVSDVVGNLTGNVLGNVTGNVTGNLTGNVTGNVTGNADTATSAAKLASANFTIVEVSGVLQFKYGSTVIAKIDSSGNITTVADITAYGAM